MISSDYPAWICHSCGKKYGRGFPKDHLATYHAGDPCGLCGQVTMTTEPRDYGGLVPNWRQLVHQQGKR